MPTPRNLTVSLMLFLFTAAASADSLVYVLTGNQQFGTVDLATGAFNQIGPNTPEVEGGLVPGPNGSFLTLTVSGNLDAINPATGVTSFIGPTGLGDCATPASPCGPTSADTIAGLRGIVYATDFQNNLYRVNPATGAATLIGPTGVPPVTFVPLSTPNPDGSLNFYGEGLSGANGNLYATFETGTVNFTTGGVTPAMSDHLYRIDPATGATTVVASTTFGIETFVDVNGTFYGFNNATGEISTLDLVNGNTTFVSNLDPAAGLIFGATATPEPASLPLAVIGIGLALIWRRRARKVLRAGTLSGGNFMRFQYKLPAGTGLKGMMNVLTKLILTVPLALVAITVPAAADPLVYTVSAGLTGNGAFGTVDLATGAFQQIGPTEPEGYFGLASGPNGSLVSLTYAGNLDSIDPATGSFTRIGPTGLGACAVPSASCGATSAFSLGGFDGRIYATDFANNFYLVSPITGAATLLRHGSGIPASPFVLGSQNADGTLNFADEAIWQSGGKLYATYDAMRFDPNTGSVTGVVIPAELYELDPATGIATVVGSTELGIGAVADVNGTEYAFDDLTNEILTLDLTNGSTKLTGSFDTGAGVIQGASPVPEPDSTALAATGLGLVLIWIWRKRAFAVAPEGGNLMRFPHMTTISVCTLGILCTLAIPAQADSIPITYSLTGMGTVVGSTPTTLTLVGQFSGSVLSGDPGLNAAWNPVSYSDQSVADLTTGLLNGNFSIVFANGNTLSGNVFEDVSAIIASPSGTGPFAQTLTFTAGTGEFAAATGSASGNGFVGTTVGTVSGSGSLDAPAIPEPTSTMLVAIGIGLVLTWRRRVLRLRGGVLGLIIYVGPLLFAVSATADSVYVVNGTTFGTVDLGTGAFQSIGPGTPEGGSGLVPGPNGSLVTIAFNGNLDSINPATGMATIIGPTGLGDCLFPTSPCGPNSASTIAGLGGTIYATDLANNLYRVNPLTGAATLIGPTGIPALPFKLLASNPDGTFNAYDQALFGANGKLYATFDAFTVNSTTFTLGSVVLPDNLYQIDPTTGVATVIGPTDLNLAAVADVNGISYAFDDGTSQILTLDLTNGHTSFVSDFDPAAGTVTGAIATPEPGSLMLAVLVLGIILIWRPAAIRYRR